jgi:hypothetical protein
MSYQKFVTMFCDGCENSVMTDCTTVADAREYLVDWKTGPSEDLCPSCCYEEL